MKCRMLFLFQIGAIKTAERNIVISNTMQFLFQIGAIKTPTFRFRYNMIYSRFYSRLVRLKQLPLANILPSGLSFYSRLVRLKLFTKAGYRTIKYRFLFQIGAIKTPLPQFLECEMKFLFQIGAIKTVWWWVCVWGGRVRFYSRLVRLKRHCIIP